MRKIMALFLAILVFFIFFPREMYIYDVFLAMENDELIKKEYVHNVFCDCSDNYVSEFQNYLTNKGYAFVFHSKLWSSKDVVYAMVNNLKAEKKQSMIQMRVSGFFFKEINYSIQTSSFNGVSGKIKILNFGFFTKIISNEKRSPRA